MLKVVILAGGRGERFWPLSRRRRPKPFLALGARDSLLRETVRRARSIAPSGAIRVVTGSSLCAAVRRELRGLGTSPVLVEPAARNTGPAAVLAAREIAARDPRSEILTLPSDHRVTGLREFRAAVATARRPGPPGVPGHLRHHARRSQSRLRLHRPGRAARCFRPPGRAVRGEAPSRGRPAADLPGRGGVELGHVRLEGRGLPGGGGAVRALLPPLARDCRERRRESLLPRAAHSGICLPFRWIGPFWSAPAGSRW